MVSHVELLLTELRRLVLLWDELWVAVLQQIHPQVEQLFQKLQSSIQKMQKKGTLTEDNRKHMVHQHCQVLFKPVSHPVRIFQDLSGFFFNNLIFGNVVDPAGP